jgi:hypothetical protein
MMRWRRRALELIESRDFGLGAAPRLLYTEDLNDGQRYGTVRVRNPFGR